MKDSIAANPIQCVKRAAIGVFTGTAICAVGVVGVGLSIWSGLLGLNQGPSYVADPAIGMVAGGWIGNPTSLLIAGSVSGLIFLVGSWMLVHSFQLILAAVEAVSDRYTKSAIEYPARYATGVVNHLASHAGDGLRNDLTMALAKAGGMLLLSRLVVRSAERQRVNAKSALQSRIVSALIEGAFFAIRSRMQTGRASQRRREELAA